MDPWERLLAASKVPLPFKAPPAVPGPVLPSATPPPLDEQTAALQNALNTFNKEKAVASPSPEYDETDESWKAPTPDSSAEPTQAEPLVGSSGAGSPSTLMDPWQSLLQAVGGNRGRSRSPPPVQRTPTQPPAPPPRLTLPLTPKQPTMPPPIGIVPAPPEPPKSMPVRVPPRRLVPQPKPPPPSYWREGNDTALEPNRRGGTQSNPCQPRARGGIHNSNVQWHSLKALAERQGWLDDFLKEYKKPPNQTQRAARAANAANE